MSETIHPGVLLRQELKAYRVPVTYAAKYLGISRSQLHRVLRGECAVSRRLAGSLEGKYGGNQTWWLNLQKEYDAAKFANKLKQMREI